MTVVSGRGMRGRIRVCMRECVSRVISEYAKLCREVCQRVDKYVCGRLILVTAAEVSGIARV